VNSKFNGELEEQWHFLSLERIFIENKIYRDIEEMTTKETVIKAVDDGLKPYKHLKRAVTEEDILRLLDIRIMRISNLTVTKHRIKSKRWKYRTSKTQFRTSD
jgi:topoisomerase-4 subunit A